VKWRSYPIRRVSKVRWLGNLPEHWQIRSLKRLARVELSNVDKLTVEGERLVRLCNYVDVYKNERIGATLPFMQASASKEQIRRLSLRRGDVIITKDSETPDDIGVPALVAEDMEDVVCGYHLALVRPKQAQADGGFLQRVMQSAYVRAEFCCSAVGMTRYGLGKYDIENVALPAPPLDEQETIARFLDRETAKLDTLIAKQERLIELLQDKRQAVISHAVTKGLDPKAPMKESGVEWLGEIPAHWRAKRLKFISPFITVGIVVNPSTYVADEGLPFIYGGDIAEGRIDAFGARRIREGLNKSR
jgi:type I restriction enzyme S subunit